MSILEAIDYPLDNKRKELLKVRVPSMGHAEAFLERNGIKDAALNMYAGDFRITSSTPITMRKKIIESATSKGMNVSSI